jgi:drug/metabolite transporter (DMT)-like permease
LDKPVLKKYADYISNTIFVVLICVYLFFIFRMREEFSIWLLVFLALIGFIGLALIAKSVFKKSDRNIT